MSAVSRLFAEWMAERGAIDVWASGEPDEDDLREAFEAGWAACYAARWEPVGGLPDAGLTREAKAAKK